MNVNEMIIAMIVAIKAVLIVLVITMIGVDQNGSK